MPYVKKYAPALWTTMPNAKLKTCDGLAGVRRKYIRDKKKFLTKHPMCAVFPDKRATQIHHRFGRRGELLLWQPGWVSVSQDGHSKIHKNIKWAREQGFIGPLGTWNSFAKASAIL